MYVKNKTIILRSDLNVPIVDGNIIDDTKIIKSLETINYLLQENCKIIILSHLGRVKTESDKINNSLKPIKNHLEHLLNKEIKFSSDILSADTRLLAENLQPQDILLLENTRFLDIPNMLESNLDLDTAKKIAELGEIFVLDAFASLHRAHTSVVGIPQFLPNCLGFLVEEELKLLDSTVINPTHPFTVIVGGAKVDDKLEIIKSILPKCDHLLLSGGIANSFLNTLGLSVGESLCTKNNDIKKELKELMLKYKEKFAFPLDAIVTSTYHNNPSLKAINNIDANDIIKDIGSKTIYKYQKIINDSKTIFINGPMGVYEDKEFNNGTNEIFNILKNSQANVLIGGGDTISAMNKLGFKNDFQNVSSGGGATLEYIAKQTLPGIEAISEEDEIEILDL